MAVFTRCTPPVRTRSGLLYAKIFFLSSPSVREVGVSAEGVLGASAVLSDDDFLSPYNFFSFGGLSLWDFLSPALFLSSCGFFAPGGFTVAPSVSGGVSGTAHGSYSPGAGTAHVSCCNSFRT